MGSVKLKTIWNPLRQWFIIYSDHKRFNFHCFKIPNLFCLVTPPLPPPPTSFYKFLLRVGGLGESPTPFHNNPSPLWYSVSVWGRGGHFRLLNSSYSIPCEKNCQTFFIAAERPSAKETFWVNIENFLDRCSSGSCWPVGSNFLNSKIEEFCFKIFFNGPNPTSLCLFMFFLVDIWSTEWRVDRKKHDDWPKKILIKFLYVL